MSSLLTVKDVADSVSAIVSVNPLFRGKNLTVTVIANEKAGGFTQKKKSKLHKILFEQAKNRSEKKEKQVLSVENRVYITEYSGHGEELANAEVAQSLAAQKDDSFHMIVAAGGDGTSLEVQTGLYKAALSSEVKKNAVMNNIAVFRLPLGTGNDGTDGRTVEESLAILEGPNHFALSKVITMNTNPDAGEKEWYSFNIASIGIDAFVVYKTNQMKSKIPGDSYHLWVNLSALQYNSLYPPKNAVIEMFDENGTKIDESVQKFEMCVFGVSGHRCYGGGHNILPTDHNVVIPPKCSSAEMAVINHKFVDGSFIKMKKFEKQYTASKIKVHYEHEIFCQLDGEHHLLKKEHFPIEMKLSDPVIQIIESDSQTVDKGAVRK